MNQIEIVSEYIKNNFTHFIQISDKIWSFKEGEVDKIVCIVEEKQESEKSILFDKEFKLLLSEEEENSKADYFVFCFGGLFYYIKKEDLKKTKLHIFRYLGKYEVSNDGFAHLGIHSTFTLLDGCQKIDDYIVKAKYLDMKALGIVEKNSLRSLIKFQDACKKENLKFVLGMDTKVKIGNGFYWFKLYIKNKEGWVDLIQISNEINVYARERNEDYIEENKLRKFLKNKNLICVLPNDFPFEDLIKYYKNFDCYYQIDTIEFLKQDYYYKYLSNIKTYLLEYSDIINPVLLSDSFYLDKEDKDIQNCLRKIGRYQSFEYASVSQHFKSIDEHLEIFSKFWKNNQDLYEDIMEVSISNTMEIVKKCNFEIKFEKLHIPDAIIDEEDLINILKEEKLYK